MTGYLSNAAPPGARRPFSRCKANRLTALAASVSFAAIASPAYAQCVQGPPNSFTCSGTTDVSQSIVSDDANVTAAPGFQVDTTNNGNGLALSVTGNGLIRFDGSPTLTGAGVRFSTTGASGSSLGALDIASAGTIVANGANGLRLDNNGGGDTIATWVGSITNSGGNGIFARNFPGSGELSLLVRDVAGRDDGIRVEHGGSGTATVTAFGPVSGSTAAGMRVNTAGAAGPVDLTLADVTGGTYGILVNNTGIGFTRVDATGTVIGQSEEGIRVTGGANTLGIDIRAARVNSAVAGIHADNQGTGSIAIVATGAVTVDGNGIVATNGAKAQDISITAADVSGYYGIRTFNEGSGATSIAASGLVTGVDHGIVAENLAGSTDLDIDVGDVVADGFGIETVNSGSGTTNVVARTVTAQDQVGVRLFAQDSAGSVNLDVGDVTGGQVGIVVVNNGIGAARVTATGTVTGVNGIGINVSNDASGTDIDIHAHDVNGSGIGGILAINEGTGDTRIVATGLVASDGIDGIVALNEGTARNLSISAFDVIGGFGIAARNSGTGATEVIATGTVAGFSADGVSVGNIGGGTDLRVDVNAVNGQDRGLWVRNEGAGSTSIRAHGLVTGATGIGISAATGITAQDLFMNVVDVTGTSGIVVDNQGVGTTSIVSAGTVTGTEGSGINVLSGTLTNDIVIDVATVVGQTSGVNVTNFGSGETNITASGTVSALAADGYGIVVQTGTGATDIRIAAADVLGNAGGLYAINLGSGETAITSTGTITGGSSFGLFARNDAGATDLTVSANTVLGAEDGIVTEHVGTGMTRIAAASATGTSGAGVRVTTEATAGAVDVALGNAAGGTYGVLVSNYGTGSTTVETSGVVTGADAGIAIENGASATGIALRAARVAGDSYGIRIENRSAGDTSVIASGPVTATAGMGMFVLNDIAAGNIRVEAADVKGAATGMLVVNQGTGTTSITTGGLVSGTSGAGIDARADVGALGLTVSAVDVSGASGITVQNFGQGSAGISATGTVTALDPTGKGIAVVGGTGSKDLSVAAARVAGGAYGIDTMNVGTGDTLILASGLVSGSEVAVRARNGAGTGGLGIRTAEIQSAGSGIVAENLGSGRTVVRAEGKVAAQGEVGIAVSTGAAANDVAVIAGSVSGAFGGIWVDNQGIGSTRIDASGAVSGDDFGIIAQNGTGSTDLTIVAVDAQGGGNAILAENLGAGATHITATGNVVGQNQSGIVAFAGSTASDIVIEAGNASGGVSGIAAINFGLGDTSITVNGTVHGATTGIEASSDGNQNVVIVNNGTVRNSSGLSSDRAIIASGGGVGIGNAGALIGTIGIAGDQSLTVNSGSWRGIGGVSDFATLDDRLLNTATGTLVGAAAAATAETTIWQGLERFTNQGMLRLQDGGIGDRIQTSAATSFTSGSILAVDIAGANGADLYHSSGTVQIEPGARLQVGASKPLALHGKYVVVQADKGLSGQFAFEDQLLTAFAGLRDGYTATTAFVEFAQLKPLAGAGLTPNQKETAGGADSLPDGNMLKDALLLLPDDAAAQDAFDQLSGEVHPTVRGVMFDDSRLVRHAVLDRLAGNVPGWTAWARGFGASGQNDGDFNAARANRDTRGGIIGVDRAFGAVTFGMAGGWTDTDVQVQRRASKGSISTAHALAYAGLDLGQFHLRGGLGYAWTTIDTRRSIAFQGFADQTTAHYKGSVLQAYGEAGYRLPLSGGYVEPFLGLTTIRARTDAFAEKGGLAALSGEKARETRTGSTVGLRIETAPAGTISVRGSIGWNRSWGDLDPVGLHAFSGGAPFTVLGAAGSRDSALARFDAQMRLSSNVTLSIGYDGALGKRDDDHAVTGGLRIVF